MERLLKVLLKNKDDKYGDFIARLTPSVKRDYIIGVRVPFIRQLTKSVSITEQRHFFDELPHKYYEEGLLHGFLIQKMNNYDECIVEVERFLPYINNWATCDTMMPKCFFKNSDDVFQRINVWVKSKQTYAVRFSLLCLMNLFLDDKFNKDILDIPLTIKSDEYYINIMIAWFYATALLKQYDETIKLLENGKLDKWIHNKTIQKAIDSRRISEAQKQYLKSLRK